MLIQVPEKATDPDFEKLLNALKVCSAIRNRSQLIRLLDNSIAEKIKYCDSINETAISIIFAFSGFPQKIDGLLKAIKIIDKETIYVKELYDVVFEIAYNQQKELNYSKDYFSEDFSREINIDENIDLIEFDSLWLDLCSILDEVDWYYIWEALAKVINFSRREILNNEVYVKSFCFTKNYDLLKKVINDQYNTNCLMDFGEQLNELLDKSNQVLVSWLEKIKQINKDGLELQEDIRISSSIPILIIIADQNTIHNNWVVQAQLKFQGSQEKIELERDGIVGSSCDEFEKIPKQIEAYIDYLDGEPKLETIETSNLPLDNLRIEVFIPILDLGFNFDCWAEASAKRDNSLVQEHQIFLRSRERIKGNKGKRYRKLLKKGWEKLELFIEDQCPEINTTILAENIDDTQQESNVISIQRNDQVDNWTQLTNFIKNCNKLWGVRLQDTLPEDINERGKFLDFISRSGIPLVFWYWENIPDALRQLVETEFQNCFCKTKLSNRCHDFLMNIWKLRSNAWGYDNEAKRKESSGYYFGMLLEDPEIMPIDADLKTAGGRK